MMNKYLLLALTFALSHPGCGDKEQMETLAQQNREIKEEIRALKQEVGKLGFLASRMVGIKARIETNLGDIGLKLFPEKAPIHCLAFLTRAESGFYDNTQFHRVIPGFMIQGGDPNSKDSDPANDGLGGPLVTIPHEFNDVRHMRGVLSMARVSDKSAGAGSQFFIVHANSSHLDGQYTAFGEVTRGMDVVDRIAAVETHPRLKDHPLKPVVIRAIQVSR